MRATTIILASAAVLAMGTQAQIKGQIAALDSSDSYCFFLPPMVGGDIAANEDKAIAFCNKPNDRAPGAKIFPPGFVLSAHWATGKDWVQITGQIDPAQYQLNPCDTGGQYDIKAPVGASCAGYAHFVNVIEPEIGVYGMKCCQQKADCDVTHSTYGVKRIYGAEYDFSGPRADGPLPLSLKCVNGSLPPGMTTTPPSGGATATSTASSAGPTGASSTGVSSTSSGAPVQMTPPAADSKIAPEEKNEANAASGVNVMMAATAVLASAAGLFLA
ncbi:hypothetical protein BGZ51_006647 [Haplosporangium sp. Z 767]|nr:hypothetical protein BGZ51_006647 [Haplosporangium sp. Z 767]